MRGTLEESLPPRPGAPRVCILTETFFPVVGGGETQARTLAEDLIASGVEVLLVTRRSSAALKPFERIGTLAVYRIPPVGRRPLARWGLLLTSLLTLARLQRRYDLLFVSGFKALGIPALLISRIFGKTCILKADSNGEMSGAFFASGLRRVGFTHSSLLPRGLIGLRNRILRRADCFVAISSDIEAELLACHVPPGMIARIPNSVDTTRFHPVEAADRQMLRERLSLPAAKTIVIYTGRLVSYKGLPLLLQVWKQIVIHHPDAYLLLVGSGGLDSHNCEAELHDRVSAWHLDESVRFTGDVRNVHEYLQASDIFVFPTEKEAFGISLIEAMACGLPSVATAVGGIKDILIHNQNGLLIEPGNPNALYQAIRLLITQRPLAQALGAAGLQSVRARYAREMVAQKYLKLFNSIAAQRSPN